LAASVEHEESFRLPLEYLDNNATATDILLRTMTECGVENIVFSSTAAVYGQTDIVPTPEDAPLNPNSPYGYSKALAEQLIRFYADYKGLKAVIFRYFNACGSDFDGQIKNPHSSCLMSAIMDVVVNRKKLFVINGNDYETFDGTCVRDFVHVLDIAKAHVLSLDKIDSLGKYNVYNVGSNHGFSVQQVIQATAEITGHMIPLEIGSRRPGDVASSVADNTKIRQELGFRLGQSDLETMISTAWNSVKA
jgi:UDP-glucose 4-epimerase